MCPADESGATGDAAPGMGELVARYYEDLRAIAASKRLRLSLRESSPTSIVAGTTLRMLSQRQVPGEKDHFLAIATTIMSRYILDELRKKHAAKRSPANHRPQGAARDDGSPGAAREVPGDIVNQLQRLSQLHPRQAEAFSLQVFCGLTAERIAALLGVSIPTVERDLRFARAWLAERLSAGDQP
jgi:RNA polymerase sigma factor (TIGR02999 family)